MIIATENAAALPTRLQFSRIMLSVISAISNLFIGFWNKYFFATKPAITDSSMTIEPSTSNPKSSAPKLIRFPTTSNCFINITAQSIEIGIAIATNAPPFTVPRVTISVTNTSSAPSVRLINMVDKARLINSDLS